MSGSIQESMLNKVNLLSRVLRSGMKRQEEQRILQQLIVMILMKLEKVDVIVFYFVDKLVAVKLTQALHLH